MPSDYYSDTTWGRCGRRPVVPITGTRFGVNMSSAISPQGQLCIMPTEGRATAPVFVDILGRLMVNASARVFLVVEYHPVDRAKSVKRFVEGQNGRLELHHLPAYSPELNLDESAWNNLKAHALKAKWLRCVRRYATLG